MTVSRRSTLVALGAAMTGCALHVGEDEDTLSEEITLANSGIPPWHLWGSSQGLQLATQPGGVTTITGRQQLAQVRYKRPDNWQFMLGARVNGGILSAPATLTVSFDLTIGVGRSVIQVLDWHRFVFQLAAGAFNAIQKWTSSVQPPAVNDAQPAVLPGPCTAVTAESLVIECRATANFGGTDSLAIIVDGQVAPSTHVRPEWYDHQYPGGEKGGA